MPNNQLPNPKEALKGSLSVPRSIEASLPTGMPQISSALSNIIDSLPDITAPTFQLPQLPVAGAGFNGVTDFIRGIEASLPQGTPKLSQAIGSKVVIGTVMESPPALPVFKIGV